jgi:1,4-dihydroxy-2-naphthoate octaprenyltransferase
MKGDKSKEGSSIWMSFLWGGTRRTFYASILVVIAGMIVAAVGVAHNNWGVAAIGGLVFIVAWLYRGVMQLRWLSDK